MRALNLDYREDNSLRNWLGYLILALAAALALAIAVHFSHLRQQASALQSQIDAIDNRVQSKASAKNSDLPPQKLAEVFKFSNRTIHQLNLPWTILFAQLEKAKEEGVALLSVEPNANNSTIKVAGEAKNYEAMLRYVRTLSEQGVFQGVYLTDHKMDEQNPDKPIHFSLEASWRAN